MIDNLSILLSHGLLLFMFWLLLNRPDLDAEAPPEPDAEPEGFVKKRDQAAPAAKPVSGSDSRDA